MVSAIHVQTATCAKNFRSRFFLSASHRCDEQRASPNINVHAAAWSGALLVAQPPLIDPHIDECRLNAVVAVERQQAVVYQRCRQGVLLRHRE